MSVGICSFCKLKLGGIIMSNNIYRLTYLYPIHPGETLKETMEELNISVKELADKTNVEVSYIENIIDGKSSITVDFAKELEKVFGIDCSFWINLQANYDKAVDKSPL